jgi:AraC-like DNA-binding protein
MMLLISARTRRAWAVGRGTAFRLWWIEFQTPTVPPFSYLLLPGCELSCELASYRRLACLQNLRGRRHELQVEGEFKALLARFLSSVSPGRAVSRGQSRRTSGDQAIVKAVEWLGANYAQPGALDELPERVGLSPNHFRLLFKRHCGVSAQAYLTAQRMRAARAMLQETARAVKDIAHALGYSDALFFSRHYRTFWKRTPTDDRAFNP